MPRRQLMRSVAFIAIMLTILATSSVTEAAGESYTPPLLISDRPITVSRLIDMARESRAPYRQSLADEDLIGILRAGAVGQFLPSLSAGGSWSNSDSQQESIYVDGIPISQGGTFVNSSSRWYLSANETLFSGLSRYYGYRQAELQVQNMLLATERAYDVLVSDVKSAVYIVLAAERALEVEGEILNQRNEVLRLATTRYETGDVIQIDVMQAEIDVGIQKNAVLSAEQSLQNAHELLNLAVGLDLESDYQVAGELTPVLPAINPDSLVSIAIRARPDLKQQRNLVESNEYGVKVRTADYIPTASAYASYYRSESQSDLFEWSVMPGDRNISYGLNLNWTLFDGFSREVLREQAVITKRKSMWDEHQFEQNISASVRQQWRSLTRLYQQIEVADRNRELARRQLDLEQERYRVGVSNQLNMRSAQVTFVTAEREYLARILDFFTTMATLERDLGMPLEEIAR
ncbi:outer membrane efflux protein [bacterium BMS3Bbin04]|nr:outer membrane efflux protein [bacterium BMS3Bbin04]